MLTRTRLISPPTARWSRRSVSRGAWALTSCSRATASFLARQHFLYLLPLPQWTWFALPSLPRPRRLHATCSAASPTCTTAGIASEWCTRRAAADCYREVIAFIRDHPDDYEPGFEEVFVRGYSSSFEGVSGPMHWWPRQNTPEACATRIA
jgi:hypothetical protein